MNQTNESINELQGVAQVGKTDSNINYTLINHLKGLSTSDLALIILKARLAEQSKS